jgi:S1-C subfamily serine protease
MNVLNTLRYTAIAWALFYWLPASAASIPPFFIETVVALGGDQLVQKQKPDGSVQFVNEWVTEGTGFLYGYRVKDDPDITKQQFQTFLVTARHVIEGHRLINPNSIQVRLNTDESSGGAREFSSMLSGPNSWFFAKDPAIDVAIVPVDLNSLKSMKIDVNFFANTAHAANKAKLKELGVSAGDSIFVLGFPMNMAGEQKNYVIVRGGVIARISECLDGQANTFLIDSFVFPGNSGGPVVSKPDINSIQGTKSINAANLIGAKDGARALAVAAANGFRQRVV